jgi:predicted nucleic acid-binding protein
MADFEDAMQVAAARACGARHIVTRNVRDYQRSPIRAVDPQEALSGLF